MDLVRPKVLFVDDEPILRLTLPLVLEQYGFNVVAAGDVTSAIDLITKQSFDVLLSDLNMGELSDGFTLVSAMRKLQPNCRTLILTGYPDFQGALERLLGQADGYILKPTRPDALASRIRQQLEAPHLSSPPKHKQLDELLMEYKQSLLERWAASVKRDPVLNRLQTFDEQPLNRIPEVVEEVIAALKSQRIPAQNRDQVREGALEAARQHGLLRKQQGFTLEQLFKEVRLLQCCMFELAQENLLDLDVSGIIPALTLATDTIEILVAASIRAFVEAERGQAAEPLRSAV